MSVTIAGLTFETKSAAYAEVKRRLPSDASPSAKPLSLDDFWFDLLRASGSMTAKAELIDGEIVAIGYRTAPRGKAIQIGLLSDSGDFVPFSWLGALDRLFDPGREPSRRQRVKGGFRRAIADQIATFRSGRTNAGTIQCEITGQTLRPNEVHIDHHPRSFDSIADEFIAALTPVEFASPLIRTHADDIMHDRFADPAIDKAWQAFHAMTATLRPIRADLNLSKKRV